MNIIKKTIITTVGKMSRPMILSTFVTIGDLSKALYKKNGKEALPIITEVASKTGLERAKVMQGIMPVKDMKDVIELFRMMDSIMGMGMEIIESSDEVFHFKMPKCIGGLEGTSKELCEAVMTSDKNTVSNLLGQAVEMKILKSVAAGDKNCEVIFSKK